MILFNLSSALRIVLIIFSVIIIATNIFIVSDSKYNRYKSSIRTSVFSVFWALTISLILLELFVIQTAYVEGIIINYPINLRYVLLINIVIGIILNVINLIGKNKILIYNVVLFAIAIVAVIFMMPFFKKVTYYVIGLIVLTIITLLDLFFRLKDKKSLITGERIKLIIQNLDVGLIVFNKNGFVFDYNDKFKNILKQEKVSYIENYQDLEIILRALENKNSIYKFKAGLFYVDYHYSEDNSFHLTFIDVTDEERLSQELEKLKMTKNQDIVELNEKLVSADELYKLKARSALALKAHDQIGQIMTILGLAIDLSLAPNVTKTEVNQKIIQANKAIESLKQSSFYETSFSEMIDNFNESFKYLNFKIILNGTPPSFMNSIGKVAEEVLSEIINNAIKHDAASKLYIDCSDNKISITNNGSSKVVLHEGMGLKGMKEKLATHELNLEIKKYKNAILIEISKMDNQKKASNL